MPGWLVLVDIPSLRRLYGVWTERLGTPYGRAARVDFIAAIAAMLGVLVFDTLPGGIAVSLLLLVYRASRPNRVPETPRWADLRRHAGSLTLDGIVVPRPEGARFFADEMLTRLGDELDPAGVRLLVAPDIGQVRDVLRTAGDEHQAVFRSVAGAVAAAQDRARA